MGTGSRSIYPFVEDELFVGWRELRKLRKLKEMNRARGYLALFFDRRFRFVVEAHASIFLDEFRVW
jgi:hypothetical protein